MHSVKLALNAMATRFELVLHGDDPVFLRAAGQEALAEIKRLHQRLSFYDPSSSISHINRTAYKYPVKINPNLFSLLTLSKDLYQLTHGAFDVTIGPLMKTWGFVQGSGAWPTESDRIEALDKTGMNKVILDDDTCTVAFQRDGMAIDLGAIGKGYAIEEATKILHECGITSALLHGGTSTMTAIGTPSQDDDGWSIGVVDPLDHSNVLTSVTLNDEAFSVSAPHGKAFKEDNQILGHIIDPRLGYPVQSANLSAVSYSSATVCDALSTAFLVLEPDEISKIAQNFNKIRILGIYPRENEQNYVEIGFPSINQ
ncbi:MAG: FAD:protein FMN transferase [Bacteroidetes bacterium]|nr:FAD:protein FMN transferase [Bacteroidota bacterium]